MICMQDAMQALKRAVIPSENHIALYVRKTFRLQFRRTDYYENIEGLQNFVVAPCYQLPRQRKRRQDNQPQRRQEEPDVPGEPQEDFREAGPERGDLLQACLTALNDFWLITNYLR